MENQTAKFKPGERLYYIKKAGNGYIIAYGTITAVKPDEVTPLYKFRHRQDNGHQTEIYIPEHSVAKTPAELVRPLLSAVTAGVTTYDKPNF